MSEKFVPAINQLQLLVLNLINEVQIKVCLFFFILFLRYDFVVLTTLKANEELNSSTIEGSKFIRSKVVC